MTAFICPFGVPAVSFFCFCFGQVCPPSSTSINFSPYPCLPFLANVGLQQQVKAPSTTCHSRTSSDLTSNLIAIPLWNTTSSSSGKTLSSTKKKKVPLLFCRHVNGGNSA